MAGALLSVLMAALSGVLVFLSFPTYDLFVLGWVAYVPLLVVVERGSARRAFWLGWLAGTITNAGGFYWIGTMLQEFGHLPPWVSWPVAGLLFLYQGLVPALWLGLGRALRLRLDASPLWIYPPLFVAVEHLVPFLFPWYLANGQWPFLAFIQVADLGGVALVSGLLVLMHTGLARVVGWLVDSSGPFPRRALFVPVLLWLVTLLYGVVRIDQVDREVLRAPSWKVGMVEADVGIWEKEARYLSPEERVRTLYKNLLTHQRLSARVQEEGVDLVVWPESSYIPYGPSWVKASDRFFLLAGRGVEVLGRGPDEPWLRESLEAARRGLPGDGRDLALRGVWGARDDDVWLVGDAGLVMRFDGVAFRRVPSGLGEDLRACSGAPGGGVVVVGAKGGIYAFDDQGQVRTLRSPDGRGLAGVSRAGGGALVAVGQGGRILRVEGDTVREERAPRGADLLAVDAPFAVGRGGLALLRDTGGEWRSLDTGSDQDLYAVREIGDGKALAVGARGTALLLGRGGVRRLSPPTGQALHAIARYGDTLLVAGDGGVVLRASPDLLSWHREEVPLEVDVRAAWGLDPFPAPIVPRQTRWFYRSDVPLPPLTGDAVEEVRQYRRAAPADRDTVQRGFDRPVLLGVATRDEASGAYYNSAVLLSAAGRVEGRVDKTHLLLFGEYLPLADRFPILRRWIPEAGRFTPGDRVEPIVFGGARIGVLVCYEDILPAFTRRVAGKQPHFLVNVTNDAWFGKTSEPYQHLVLALFRSIEHRRALVRSTNTGVSAFVDPVGRLVSQTSLDGAETLVGQVPLMESGTLYGALGDWVAWSAVGLSLALWAISLVWGGGSGKGRGRRQGGKAPARKPKAAATGKGEGEPRGGKASRQDMVAPAGAGA